jgi:hypothetical protein
MLRPPRVRLHRVCAPAAHAWRFTTSLVLSVADTTGHYTMVKILTCDRCHSAACEVLDVDHPARTACLVAIGEVAPDGGYREVDVRQKEQA